MKSFFKKYGSSLVFFTVLLLFAMFFVQIVALTNTYSDKVAEQAVERAQYFVQEQSKYVESQIESVRLQTDNVARNVDRARSKEEAITYVKSFRSDSIGDDFFADVLYADGGMLYDCYDNQVTAYPDLSALLTADSGALSRVFQYENLVMSIGVWSKTTENLDGVIVVYDRNAVSLDFAKEDDYKDLDCVKLPLFALLCKYDGRPVSRIVNDDSYQIGALPVQTDLFPRYISDEADYTALTEYVNNYQSGSVKTVVDGVDYIVVVQSLGADCGNLMLVEMFRQSEVYGIAFELVSQIIGALVGLALFTALICVFFVLNKRRADKVIYNIEMVNAELDCATYRKFCVDCETVFRRHKNSSFAVVAAKINNIGYIEEHFGDEKTKGLLKHMRNVLQTSMTLAETYAYNADGEFFLLLSFTSRKTLELRLGSIARFVGKYDLGSADFRIAVSFSVYEATKGEERKIQRIAENVKMAQASAAFKQGATSINYYGDILREDYFKKAEIEGRMESALASSEFHLFYQPKYNIARGDLDGSEILVRWYDPKIGAYRQPNEFLPVFEENGFISKLDRFVFYKACENIAGRVAEGKRVFPVSVNVSRVTAIQPDFLEYYVRIKNKFDIRDNFVTLEFTESFAFENYDYLAYIVTELHKNGLLCSLDDFGTGYSSYNVLKTLSMDEIKLDKFFLERGASPERDQMLLTSIVEMIKKMGIKVTQEGVETKVDFDRLAAMGCDVIQGFYFSRPMKYVDYREFVRQNFEK